MTPIVKDQTSETILTLLARHSVRDYKKGFKLPEEHLRTILETACQAPSAWNLQHWKFMLVEEQQDKELLFPITNNQKQILDSSVTVIILGDTEANRYTEQVYGGLVEAGYAAPEYKDYMVDHVNAAYAKGGPQLARDQAVMNASLAAMQMMIAAKALGYDTVPMSGFDAGKLVEAFHIPSRYVPVMLLPIGLAELPAKPTLRLPLEELMLVTEK